MGVWEMAGVRGGEISPFPPTKKMNHQPDHYHRKRLRQKRNNQLLAVAAIVMLILALGLVTLEVMKK